MLHDFREWVGANGWVDGELVLALFGALLGAVLQPGIRRVARFFKKDPKPLSSVAQKIMSVLDRPEVYVNSCGKAKDCWEFNPQDDTLFRALEPGALGLVKITLDRKYTNVAIDDLKLNKDLTKQELAAIRARADAVQQARLTRIENNERAERWAKLGVFTGPLV